MSQKLLSPIQLLLLQCVLIGFAAAYPYVIVPSSGSSGDRRLVKRAFDRFDNSGVFSFGAKRLDRYDDDAGFGYGGYDEAGGIFKRSAEPYHFVSLPSKKAFDRLDASDFFGAKRKRSFDRIGGTEFGLMKRSISEDRENLIDNLAESITALRKVREARSSGSQPVMVTYED
ncbi:unnamed protein product [Caenorhabditis sp. 36 PRJEB53466]|nr:unnamed protein product [Caenorhabditis sp. 36 PRJEB53466]